MLEHGIGWEKKGSKKPHLKVEEYKAKQRVLEVERLDKVIENLNSESEVIDNTISIKNESLNQLDKTIDKKSVKLKKVENRLNAMLKDAKSIDNNIRKFDEEPEWQLQPPPLLMTASAYREKKALPLVYALKEYIKGSTLKFVQLKSSFDKLKRDYINLSNRHESFENLLKIRPMDMIGTIYLKKL